MHLNSLGDNSLGDVAMASVHSVGEADVVGWRRALGARLALHRGHWWEEMGYGIFQPISPLVRLTHDEVGLPTRFAIGARAALAERDADEANGAIPVHLLSDVSGFGLHVLPTTRRNRIRKSLRLVQFATIDDPDFLRSHGHAVTVAALGRTRYRKVPSREEFDRRMAASPPWRVVIGGFVDGELMGYIDGYAVDGIGYGSEFVIDPRALPTCIGSGLVFHMIEAFRRSGEVRELMTGFHAPEDPALCAFKTEFGFHVKRIPAWVRLWPWVRWVIRRRYPEKYYRLTGEAAVSPTAYNHTC